MSIKKKLKKVNRGLVLALALIVVLIIYIIVTDIRFKKSTQKIGDHASQFLNDYLKATESDIDGVWTAKDKENKLNEIESVVDKYWTTGTLGVPSEYDFFTGLNTFKGFYSDCYEGNYAGNVKNTNVSVNNAKISKYGNKGAVYSAEVTVKMSAPKYQSFPGISYQSTVVEYSWDDYDSFYKEYDQIYKDKGLILCETVDLTVKYSVSFRYIYADGEWKICQSDIEMDFMSQPTISAGYDKKYYDKESGKPVEIADTDAAADKNSDVKEGEK